MVSSALFLCATVGAGFSRGFHELLAALCVVGAAAGASISTVGLDLLLTSSSFHHSLHFLHRPFSN